jgi:predicted metal-binding membrane protein
MNEMGMDLPAWVSMMAAMMLPGAVPSIVRRIRVGSGTRSLLTFLASYLMIWTVVSVALYALYRPPGSFLAGAIVVAAGLYELTPLKHYFRRRCSEGTRSTFEFGLCCVGSCIGLMLASIAINVMSIAWMSAVAGIVVVQRVLPVKAAIDIPLGLAIAGLGVTIMLAPSLVPGLLPAICG